MITKALVIVTKLVPRDGIVRLEVCSWWWKIERLLTPALN